MTVLFPPDRSWFGNDKGNPPTDILNSMLYDAVLKYPSNTCESQIISKLILIGRTYSASVERQRKKGETANKVLTKAAEEISKSGCENLLADIRLDEELTKANLDRAVNIHLTLCEALQRANNRANSSFASKYQHFHRPKYIPIVDSLARGAWVSLMTELRRPTRGHSTLFQVKKYKTWCENVLDLRELIQKEMDVRPSLRQIDNYLLSVAHLEKDKGWAGLNTSRQ